MSHDNNGYLMMKITNDDNEGWQVGCETIEGNFSLLGSSSASSSASSSKPYGSHSNLHSTSSNNEFSSLMKPPPEKKAKTSNLSLSATKSSTFDHDDDDDEMVIFAPSKPRYDPDDDEISAATDNKPAKAATPVIPITAEKKKKATRPKKEAGAPKGPVASFMMYSNATREKVISENPGMSMADVSRAIGQLWKALTPDERTPFEDLAKKDKER
jgi:hypothetical protein